MKCFLCLCLCVYVCVCVSFLKEEIQDPVYEVKNLITNVSGLLLMIEML